MNALRAVFFALVFIGSVVAEPLVEGRVRLESGEPVVDAQVRLFDLSDLRPGAIARALTDGRGYFALPLGALGGHALPQGFALGPNYPNPFNPSTIIPYQLAASSEVRLEVFNLLGQHIATLVDGERSAGFHTATWHATDGAGRAVGAGVYIYRMTVGAERQTGRMVLVDGQAGIPAASAASVWPGGSGGASDGERAQVYGLIVSGEGLVPYVDSAFRIEAGMAPVDLVVSSGPYSAGKATDDDCALCGLFGGFNEAEEEEAETDSTSSEGGPDLIVQPPSASATVLTPGEAFTLQVTVHNQGDQPAAATILRYYRSNNTTITASDTPVGTGAVDALDASATSAQSIGLTASAGAQRYYGACVDSVRGEINTDNNCSAAVKITVSGPETPEAEEETPDEGEGEEWLPSHTPPYEEPTIVGVHNDRVVVMGIPGRVEAQDDFEPVVETFLAHYEDVFDFLFIIPNLIRGEENEFFNGGFYQAVRNEIEGIGQGIWHNGWSQGQLQGVIYLSYVDHIWYRMSLHELAHAWANHIIPTNAEGHWGFSSANGLLGGFDPATLIDHGEGEYSAHGEVEGTKGIPGLAPWGWAVNLKPYSPIELYLAGLIPADEVPDIWVAEDGEHFLEKRGDGPWWFYTKFDEFGVPIFKASKITTWSIERIQAEHGKRIPDVSQSQKEFRAVVILLVDENRPAEQSTLDFMSDQIRRLTHAGPDVDGFTRDYPRLYNFRPSDARLYNFWEATGGRATLTMDGLSAARLRAGAAKRPAFSYTLDDPIECPTPKRGDIIHYGPEYDASGALAQ